MPSAEEKLSILVQWSNSCKIHPESSKEGTEMKAFFFKNQQIKQQQQNTSLIWGGTKTSLFYIPSNCVVPTLGREILLRSSAHT